MIDEAKKDYWESLLIRWVRWNDRKPGWSGNVYLQYNNGTQSVAYVHNGMLLKLDNYLTKYHIENNKIIADYTEQQLELLNTAYWLEQLEPK